MLCFVQEPFSFSRFRPALVAPEGGSTVTISGRGFAMPMHGLLFEVTIDGKLCLSVQVISDVQLTCTTPPGSGARLKVATTPIVQVSYSGGRTPTVFDIKLETLSMAGFAYNGKRQQVAWLV